MTWGTHWYSKKNSYQKLFEGRGGSQARSDAIKVASLVDFSGNQRSVVGDVSPISWLTGKRCFHLLRALFGESGFALLVLSLHNIPLLSLQTVTEQGKQFINIRQQENNTISNKNDLKINLRVDSLRTIKKLDVRNSL